MPLTQVVLALQMAEEMVGVPGPIKLNTKIVEHSLYDDPTPPEIILTIGEKNRPVTLKDILHALTSLPHETVEYFEDRSYFFEGASQDRYNKNTWFLIWGS